MRILRSALLATACAALVAPASTAFAQDPLASEIIVTARKRQESILNVPVIETALPQAELERFQTQDISDLATRVPGLSLGESVLSIGTQVSLRGVGTSTLDAGVDQSVSLNLDGLQLSNGLAYSSGMFDVGQAEILKGPQALFYGKNSPGGVISLRTADPTDRFEVMLRGGYEFEARERRGEIVISGPVHETLRLRLASMYSRQEGFFKNEAAPLLATGALAPQRRTGYENFVLRGTALWNPSANFNARLKLNYVRDFMDGSPVQQLTSCPDGVGPVPGFGIPFIGGGEDCRKDRVFRIVDLNPVAFPGIRHEGRPFVESQQKFGTLELNYNVGPGLTLTSTTGYYLLKSSSLINGTQSTFAAPAIAAANDFRREEWTQEVRLNSDWAGSPLNFTIGGFYQDGEVSNLITLHGNTRYMLPGILRRGQHNLEINSLSFFGQARWQVLDRLELAAGARWTEEKRTDAPVDLLSGTPRPVRLQIPSISSNNVSPELTLTYRPTDTLTVFGSLKKGYKSGSFTITTPAADDLRNAFGDEQVKGGEAGFKTRLFDRRLALNGAYYNYRYTGLQVGANSPAKNGLPEIVTINAGAAQVYGIDLDASYRPAQIVGLGLNVAVNWNHARFKRLENVPCWGGQMPSEGCTPRLIQGVLIPAQDLAGNRMVRAPDWQASFGFDYERPLGGGLTLGVSNTNQYSSRFLVNLGNRPDFYQKGFIKTDLSLTLSGPDDRWEVALIGKNIANRLTVGNCVNFNAANGQVLGGVNTGGTTRGPAGVDEVGCLTDRGREVWVRVTFRPTN